MSAEVRFQADKLFLKISGGIYNDKYISKR
nr:MAG TPA: hypothetical protein [Caudoviricetes sp.]